MKTVGIALTSMGHVGNNSTIIAFWLEEMEVTVTARCNPISEILKCEKMCVLESVTCSSRAARLHFTYKSEPKESEFSLLNAFEVLFLFLIFSLSACTFHQNTEKNLCMFPKEPPSSYPVFGLSEPGRPSAND